MSCTKQCASLHKTGIRLRRVGVFTSCDDDDDDDDDVDGECGCICNGLAAMGTVEGWVHG